MGEVFGGVSRPSGFVNEWAPEVVNCGFFGAVIR